MNVYQRLNDAREKFHALKLQKTGHNKFAGYYYFELGDFLIPALKVFRECGLCATVSFDTDKACMVIRNAEKPDEYLTIYSPMGSAALKGCHEVQNIGAVETYQRRYLWVAALEIVEHDALDATTGKDKAEPKKSTKTGVVADVLATKPPLPDAEHSYLYELAQEVINMYRSDAPMSEVFDRLEIEQLDQDQKVYVSQWFDSDLRGDLKSESASRRNRSAVTQ